MLLLLLFIVGGLLLLLEAEWMLPLRPSTENGSAEWMLPLRPSTEYGSLCPRVMVGESWRIATTGVVVKGERTAVFPRPGETEEDFFPLCEDFLVGMDRLFFC